VSGRPEGLMWVALKLLCACRSCLDHQCGECRAHLCMGSESFLPKPSGGKICPRPTKQGLQLIERFDRNLNLVMGFWAEQSFQFATGRSAFRCNKDPCHSVHVPCMRHSGTVWAIWVFL
jgi:hypothetical protein